MKTPEEVLERAQALEREGYETIPLHRLIGADWSSDSPEMEALRALLGADLIRWTDAPGFLVLAH